MPLQVAAQRSDVVCWANQAAGNLALVRLFTEIGQTILQSAEMPLMFFTGPLSCIAINVLRHAPVDSFTCNVHAAWPVNAPDQEIPSLPRSAHMINALKGGVHLAVGSPGISDSTWTVCANVTDIGDPCGCARPRGEERVALFVEPNERSCASWYGFMLS
jgi:hypothetical protein